MGAQRAALQGLVARPDQTVSCSPTYADWVHRRENLVVGGPSGTGKPFLRGALGQHAVEEGLKVAWFTLEDLGTLLRRHRADDTVAKAIARVLRADVVVVDTGLRPVARTPPTASTASLTPPTRSAPSQSARTCTRPRSTS